MGETLLSEFGRSVIDSGGLRLAALAALTALCRLTSIEK